MDDLREYLCAPPSNLRWNMTAEMRRSCGYLFNRPNDPQGRRNPLQVRERASPHTRLPEQAGQPLFAGHFMARYSGSDTNVRRDFHTTLRLSLNPLRFVRNQNVPRPIGSAQTWARPRITERATPANNAGEFSLDGCDNWLPDTPIFLAFTTPARWRAHLRRYLQAVRDALTEELQRVAEDADILVSQRDDCSLRVVETAFEFAASEPTELVRSLHPLLSSYRADNVEESEYRGPEVKRARVENSLSYRVRIRKGVYLRVYAKTNRRVRFEIRHENINVRELLGESPLPAHQNGPRPMRTTAQLLQCLAALRQRAATEMNKFLAYCRHESRVVPSLYSPLSFIVTVASVLRDRDLSHTVVSLLTNLHGIISYRKASPELLAAAHELTEAGLLRFNRERRGYIPATPYVEAVSVLRGADALHLLTTARQRRRASES